ncbi:hypothetical protein [Pseudomonas oryzae]|uniref:Molecular chaperone n=1 Tax=Pseudomonas oryzae TaxID=1392877 RepID=A0A1H1VR91_9PSED|nr:hypothetical protein [Pseudomonas oryzae]SDS87000.1 hypothetical protein SAMN05216221_2843 [Pseudomonas oryzae]
MDLHSAFDLLHVTPPDLSSLSFAAAQPAALSRWLAELPKANLGETTRRLYLAVQELNRLQTGPATRLQLLELLQPELQFACAQLEKQLRSPVVILDSRRQQIATLWHALLLQLARAAKLAASEARRLAAGDEQRSLTARALRLALQALYQLLCQHHVLYTPPSQGFWLELHQLYRFATSQQLERLALPAGALATLSIEQSYLACLLLACARTNQLRPQAILRLGEVLPAWSRLARLQAAHATDSLFAFAPATDSPPRYTKLLQDEAPEQLRGLSVQALVGVLQEYLALDAAQRRRSPLAIPDGLDDDLLQHLCSAWSAPSERSFRRISGSGRISACLGISALHYHLAGRRRFADFLQLREEELSADFQRHHRERDPWAKAFDASRNEDLLNNPHRQIDYAPGKAAPAAAEQDGEEYPRHQLQVINHSPGGYCLAWDGSSPEQLQTGDLIGLQHPDEQGWHVALIRWIRQPRGSGLQLGIELLAPRAQPCSLRTVQADGRPGQHLRGLLIGAIPALGRPPLLIAPHLPFQQGQRVLLHVDGRDQRILLSRRHVLSGSFNQFEYRSLDPAEAPKRKPVTALSLVDDGPAEDFDSLWQSL